MREGLMIRLMRLPFPTTSSSSSQRTFFYNINTSSSNSTSSSSHSTTTTTTTDSRVSSDMTTHLSKQQQDVLTAISNGESVFLTGSAGTGKTFLLRQAINVLKQMYNPHEVSVTASTGIAACALNGQTLHSFSGIGLGVGGKRCLLKKVARNKQAANRWRIVKALIIDEISMLSGELFDKLEFIARRTRVPKKTGSWGRLYFDVKDEKCWGGIQLIVSGDFFQLPPVIKNNNNNSYFDDIIKEFAFEADCWDDSFHKQVELTQVFRQSELQLIELLQGIRRGFKDPQHLQLLNQCCSNNDSLTTSATSKINSDSSNAPPPPRLFPRNEDVRRLNNERLRNLGGQIISYRAFDTGHEPWLRQLKRGIAPDELKICVGARVMLIKNKSVECGLVNGATGTVIGFTEQTGDVIRKICQGECLLPKVRFDSGLEIVVQPDNWYMKDGYIELANRTQVPLILAWAISVHKCQGMTLDSLHTDLSRAFGCGMVYVALSRVRSLDGLHLTGFDSSKIKAHPKVVEFYENHLNSDKVNLIVILL